jgi:predicted helicase
MNDLASLLAELDVGERVRGRGFERLCRWALENAPEYAAKVEKVWLCDERPGNDGRRDAGIASDLQIQRCGLSTASRKAVILRPAYR